MATWYYEFYAILLLTTIVGFAQILLLRPRSLPRGRPVFSLGQFLLVTTLVTFLFGIATFAENKGPLRLCFLVSRASFQRLAVDVSNDPTRVGALSEKRVGLFHIHSVKVIGNGRIILCLTDPR